MQIQEFSPNTGKYGPEKTPCLDTFNAMEEVAALILVFSWYNSLV